MPFEPDSDPNLPKIIPLRRGIAKPGILVTGASGFLGREIVRQFDEAGIPVRALVRQQPPSISRASTVEYCQGDITDPLSLRPALDGMTTIIHSAGLAHQFGKKSRDSQAFQRVNVQGTENVLRAAVAEQIEHVVLVSSVSVYGGGSKPTDESRDCRPTDPYGASKLKAEEVARSIADAVGMKLSILRMATIFGEEDPGNIARLIQSISRGRFVWLGTGSNRKSLIYRSDAARACVLAAQDSGHRSGDPCNVYNISMPAVTVAQIVDAIANGLGRQTRRWYIPAPFVRTVGGGMAICTAGWGPIARLNRTITKWLADDIYLADRFERDYRFQPEISLEEGLRREAAWFQNARAA